MSWERKQPKQETALVRLTRQARAINLQMHNHNRAVLRELARIGRLIERQEGFNKGAAKRLWGLRELYEKIDDLDVGYD